MICQHDDLGYSWKKFGQDAMTGAKAAGKAIVQKHFGGGKKKGAAPVVVHMPQQPPEKPFHKTTMGKIVIIGGLLYFLKDR